MPWVLDTNVWIHYLKNASSPIAERLRRSLPSEILVCAVVRAELLHGAMKYGNPERRLAIVRETLAPYVSLPFDDVAADRYAHIRHALEQAGSVIGSHDMLIAAICVAHGCTLVTSNTREFVSVPGLLIEDWLAPAGPGPNPT
jgi:tRNA(fMet)-specific endonuclease VapC